jgi:hypothetical protein
MRNSHTTVLQHRQLSAKENWPSVLHTGWAVCWHFLLRRLSEAGALVGTSRHRLDHGLFAPAPHRARLHRRQHGMRIRQRGCRATLAAVRAIDTHNMTGLDIHASRSADSAACNFSSGIFRQDDIADSSTSNHMKVIDDTFDRHVALSPCRLCRLCRLCRPSASSYFCQTSATLFI